MSKTVHAAIGTIITAIAGIIAGFGIADEATITAITAGLTGIVSGVYTIWAALTAEKELQSTKATLGAVTEKAAYKP